MSELKQRAAELTLATFNTNATGRGLWGGLRDDCLQTAHQRVQTALPRFDPTKATLSTFVWPHVDGAIKDELTRQRAGMIGTGRGANIAPVSLDGPSAPRYTSDDLSAARWHLDGAAVEASDESAEPENPPRLDYDPDSPFAPIYDAQPVTGPGADFDSVALTPEAHLGEAGKVDDRIEAPAAARRMRDERARLDWECALRDALASDLFTPADKAALRALPSDAFAVAVRQVRYRCQDASDDESAVAEAALFYMLRAFELEPVRVKRAPSAYAIEAERQRLRDTAKAVTGAWAKHLRRPGYRVPDGEVKRMRANLRAFLTDVRPEYAAALVKAFPEELAKAARWRTRLSDAGAPVSAPVRVRWLWRHYGR